MGKNITNVKCNYCGQLYRSGTGIKQHEKKHIRTGHQPLSLGGSVFANTFPTALKRMRRLTTETSNLEEQESPSDTTSEDHVRNEGPFAHNVDEQLMSSPHLMHATNLIVEDEEPAVGEVPCGTPPPLNPKP
jgi:hypothetical protein